VSGIVGIYRLDGRPVTNDEVERMNSMLAHRAPDGASVWCNGAIGLGHGMLHTTAESLSEVLPLVNYASDLAITADARIDNREELIALLNLKHRAAEEIADSQLILSAYGKWGESCIEKLVGDFAFVIWDGRQQMLLCARDHFGVRPFYYFYLPGRLYAFASEIKSLLCLSEVPRQLNELQVADYLSGIFEDKASTFYLDILRLPPAHSLSVNAHGCRARPYWALDPGSELRLGSDGEYAAAFREKFTEAVRCRMRSAFPLGSHLSGGLDSSSVSCVARKLAGENTNSQWHVFSNIFDDVPQCDERPYINAVLDQGGYIPHYIHPDRSSPLMDLERVLWHQDEPAIGPNHFLPWQLNRAAAEAGVRVVLDGFDGDTTVSHGAARFTEMAYAGKWEEFAHEASAVSQHFSVSTHSILQGYGLAAVEELAKKQRWLAVAAAISQINRFFLASRRELLWRHGLKPLIFSCRQRSSENGRHSIINPDFARRVGLQERIAVVNAARSQAPRTTREEQWQTFTSPHFSSILELSDHCAAAFAVDVRHPFMDKRLIEFCLGLPAEQKLYNGWSRIVMRRAMVEIIPEEIRWRGGKTDMNPNFLHGLLKNSRPALDEVIIDLSKRIEPYIDMRALRNIYQLLISEQTVKIVDAIAFWKIATLAYWLRQSGFTYRKGPRVKSSKNKQQFATREPIIIKDVSALTNVSRFGKKGAR
jgi:asparagine synthase (glutamine-hydrolysing)